MRASEQSTGSCSLPSFISVSPSLVSTVLTPSLCSLHFILQVHTVPSFLSFFKMFFLFSFIFRLGLAMPPKLAWMPIPTPHPPVLFWQTCTSATLFKKTDILVPTVPHILNPLWGRGSFLYKLTLHKGGLSLGLTNYGTNIFKKLHRSKPCANFDCWLSQQIVTISFIYLFIFTHSTYQSQVPFSYLLSLPLPSPLSPPLTGYVLPWGHS